jgi:predicted lipid carrier protein YhbT
MEEKATRHAAMLFFQKQLTLAGLMQLGLIVRNVLQEQKRGRHDAGRS